MFGDIAIVGSHILQQMRQEVQTGDAHKFNQDQISIFKQIAEIAIKQARVEMAVEKHVEERTSGMESAEMAQDLRRDLDNVLMKQPITDTLRQNLIDIVMMHLGLDG
ncbi:MAG: hypothetical protein KJN60_13005 [Boseongicola sp.]|nr:hypothetical protein [Boseongicola sp.]